MKFFRILNPFAVIRSLKADLAVATTNLAHARDANHFLRSKADMTFRALNVADQAVDEFMAERIRFKDRLLVAAAVVDSLEADNDTLAAVANALTAQLEASEDAVRTQAGEIVEAVSYVKSVEAALAAGGITIADTDNGPVVVVNQDLFLRRLREGAFTVEREEQGAIAA